MQGAEERVGRVSVIALARANETDYRTPASPILELKRDQLPLRPNRGQAVAIGIATFLGMLLLVFAAYFMKGPIFGVVPVPFFAIVIGAIVAFVRARPVVVRVHESDVTVGKRRIPRERVESVGVGRDDPDKTLWLLVRGEGRVLVLEGLSAGEAALAERSLSAALAV